MYANILAPSPMYQGLFRAPMLASPSAGPAGGFSMDTILRERQMSPQGQGYCPMSPQTIPGIPSPVMPMAARPGAVLDMSKKTPSPKQEPTSSSSMSHLKFSISAILAPDSHKKSRKYSIQ